MTVIASWTAVVTESAPVRVQPSDLDVFKSKGFKVIHLEGGRDIEPCIPEYT
jgi:hypothetical protein